MSNIFLLGTSHIAKQSVREIKQAFKDFEPELVALEMDPRRMHALLSNQKPSYNPALIMQIGVLGYLFALIGAFVQQKLGNIVGMRPGVEMLTAAKQARKRELRVFLIDQDIEVTLRNLSNLPFKEKYRILWELLKGFVTREKVSIDISKVPEQELIRKLVKEMKKRLPGIYKVLVADRNKVMAGRIKEIAKHYPDKKLLVIVGAGHLDGMKRILRL
ncbi:TraB/GumN family protein [Nanoarchaeota archaeon]